MKTWSKQIINILEKCGGIFSDRYKVKIAGKEIQVSKSRDHY